MTLKIIGQALRIISRGTLQVDGEVEGDVAGKEVIIGELGQVTGTVAAERVIVRGKIAIPWRASARNPCELHEGDRRSRSQFLHSVSTAMSAHCNQFAAKQ